MSAPQGIMSFPGLTEYLLSGQFTLQHGISPSICTINCAPVPKNVLVEQGNLDLRFGNVRIQFPDCKIDKIDVHKNEDGLERWSVSILDRRWKWKFAGVVSGHWNVRRGEVLVGQNLATPQIRSTKQLVEICLKAMGEERYDTSELPTDVYPEVNWDLVNAAQAMAQLCDQFGFRVVLEITDKVAMRKVGHGKQIPVVGEETQLNVTLDPPERPDNLIFAGAPNRHQFDLELEPVLRDFDGGYKFIDDLTYAPRDAAGKVRWGAPGFGQFTQDQIAANPKLELWNTYITNNLRRTWRIKEPFEVDVWINDAVQVLKLNRLNIMPLEQTLIATETNDKDVVEGGDVNRRAFVQEREPLIYGLWSGGNHALESTYHQPVNIGGTTYETVPNGEVYVLKDPLNPDMRGTGASAKSLYTLNYGINFENGYVQFADPAIRLLPSTAAEHARYVSTDISLEYTDEDGQRQILDSFTWPPSGWTFVRNIVLTNYDVMPAKLWLRVAFAVRYNQKDGSPFLYAPIKRKMPGKPLGTGPEYVRAPDIRYWIGRVKDGPLLGNKDEYLKAAKLYLDAKEKEYDVDDFASATIAGFKAYNPDGALQQVSWEVTAQGFAYTRVSRNKEEVFSGVSYTERRLYERTKALLDEIEKRKAGG